MNISTFLKKNAGTILTCIGAVGVVATAVMSAKATPKAIELLEKAEAEKRSPRENARNPTRGNRNRRMKK